MPVILGGNTGIYLASLVPPVPPVDPDAQAFITAAAITDPTQQAAINTLVVDLKGYSIWSKFSALYPFVGGTATSHKFNLKDPRDLDAAFRIFWNGGVTHSSTGVLPGGINGWGNTYFSFNATTVLNSHISTYIRTNSTTLACEFGSGDNAGTNEVFIVRNGNEYLNNQGSNIAGRVTTSTVNARGLILNSRRANNDFETYRNGITIGTSSVNNTYTGGSTYILNLFRRNVAIDLYSAKETAFASIGDGLTDTEAANFYTAVQAFQTTLGRSIGTQTVSDADAQAFVTNADIQDQVEANAINNLVIGMKADGLWTKMKAVYPFVGSSSSSNSYNLKNTAQYQLSFSGGGTWNSNGYTSGVNGYANTGLNPNTAFSTNDSMHLSLYSRTNNDLGGLDFGGLNASAVTGLYARFSNNAYAYINGGSGVLTGNTNSTGFYVGTRTSASVLKLFKNNTQLGSTYTGANGARGDLNMFLGALNVTGTAQYYTQRNYAFASIGDGLTDTDATNLNSRVTTFQTALNRNI